MAKQCKSSLPEQLAATLRVEIQASHAADDRLPTVVELARRFGVSKHSMAGALDLLARAGVITKGRRRGVHVAAGEMGWRVGILSELDLFDGRIGQHFRALAGKLKSHLRNFGVSSQLYLGHAERGRGASDEPTCPEFWHDLRAGRLDGGVILDVPCTQAWFERVQAVSAPLVGTFTGHGVEVDSEGVVRAAVRRLVGQGCRRLGLLSWHGVAPFLQAVAEHGGITDQAWIRTDLDPAVRGAGWEEFREIWSARVGRPDGLVVLDDMLFADAQLAIFELGVRVPQELRLAVQTNRGISPPIRLPAVAFEIDPSAEALVLAEQLLARLRHEPLVPTSLRISFREVAIKPAEVEAAAEAELDGGALTTSALVAGQYSGLA